MKSLEESGISIGDFAASLMDTGNISKKIQTTEVARPKELPVSELDVSEVAIPGSMVEQVLQESFGMSNEAPKRETAMEPLLSEQELLQEKIISLKHELVETINKLTSLVSEMDGMGMTTTQSIGVNLTGKYRGRNKSGRSIKRKRK